MSNGGQAWIKPPFGTHTERGALRERVLLDELVAAGFGDSLVVIDEEWRPELVDSLIDRGNCTRSLQVVGENQSWGVRLRKTDRGYAMHLLNRDLEGSEHPFMTDRWGNGKVLDRIRSKASTAPLKIDLRLPDLNAEDLLEYRMLSPELDQPRSLTSAAQIDGKLSLEIDMSDISLYAVIRLI